MTHRVGVVSLGVAALLCVPLVVSMTADAADDVLLSTGRPVLASSSSGARYAPGNAVDGNAETRWSTDAGATQWLRVDLGAAQSVDRIKLTWDSAYAKAYRLQLSADGATWTDLTSTRTGNGGVDDFKQLKASAAGRYLRLLATQRASSTGYSLREIQAYGPGPVTPKPSSTPVVVTPSSSPASPPPATPTGLNDPKLKEVALELVSSAENANLNWHANYGYLEDLGDGRGYTGGLVGFCSGTSDMLAVVTEYTRRKAVNPLAAYLPALRAVDGSDSHAGLDPGFPAAWRASATDPTFQQVQQDERDKFYFDPAVGLAKADGLRALGQFAYFDAAVVHGVDGLRAIRAQALLVTHPPAQGGDETAWLSAFLDARVRAMKAEEAHSDTTRVDTEQRAFLKASNLDLTQPLTWSVYGDRYSIG